MSDALHIGATGMQAQQLAVDTIANNLANVNTPGFKKGRVSFTDLVAHGAAPLAAASLDEGGLLAAVPSLGAGVGASSVTRAFDPGELRPTGSELDLAIQGDGFLEVAMPDGSRAFTRGGSLSVSADGMLVTRAGHPLRPGIHVPSNATAIAVAPDGRVRITASSPSGPLDAGRLELVRFANPAALLAQGDNLYRATETSGEPIPGEPGQDGIGTLAQGHLEGSNVKMLEEMVNLLVAQRAYEANVKVVQASDEMLGMVNSLRK